MLKAPCADGDAVIDYLRRTKQEMLLVGIVSPASDTFVQRRPEARRDMPVIMLSARVEQVERLLALHAGTGQSCTKPFSRREMIVRLRTLLQLLEAQPAGADSHGFRVDEERMRISYRNRILDLTPREYQLLVVLLSRPGRVFARAFLMDRLHPDWDDVSDRSIDSHIKNLRKKLAAQVSDRIFIHTIYGVGYRLEV